MFKGCERYDSRRSNGRVAVFNAALIDTCPSPLWTRWWVAYHFSGQCRRLLFSWRLITLCGHGGLTSLSEERL